MNVVETHQGSSPIILSFPHTGTFVPPAIWELLSDNGRILADTDWHVDRLYDGLLPQATSVRAIFHRYVIDANRDASGVSLYPGQNTTDLIPRTDFDGKAIWRNAFSIDDTATKTRLNEFYSPYHAALAVEIERVKSINGIAILYDCHSIRSHIPYLFDGKLPDFNIGTNDGVTCDPSIERAAVEIMQNSAGFTSVLNGRFKGGATTRNYGRPMTGVHAIQMELAQFTYLTAEAPPFEYAPTKARALRTILKPLLERIEQIAFKIAG